MSDKPRTLFVNFSPKPYEPDAFRRTMEYNRLIENEDAELPQGEKREKVSVPKAASIVVDSMCAVAERYSTCPVTKTTRVLLQCPSLLEFVRENKLRMQWVLATLRHNLPDGFYTITADAEPVRGVTFEEILSEEEDGSLPGGGPVTLIALNIERFAGPPNSD